MFVISAALLSAALLGGASASGRGLRSAHEVNQLETARLTQAAQRVEFGVEGHESAFKFTFADPVRFLPALPPDHLRTPLASGCGLRGDARMHARTRAARRRLGA